ncbi:MAG: hypothetical protein CMB82_02435 [Flammeovirgaceae bacterium]|nr:hypothetical protein [Flammeovirgaceae bacterium]
MMDRTLAPASFPVKNFNFRNSRKIKLNGDIDGLIIPDKQHSICSIEIIFQSGSWFEKNPGISFLTGKMLLEGTKTKNGEELVSAFEYMGAHIEIQTTVDDSRIRLFATQKHIHSSLSLLQEILFTPSFPTQEFKVIKNLKAEQIKMQLAKNTYFASSSFHELLFGADHPYGRCINKKEIEERSLFEIKDFFRLKFQNRPKVVICGDIDENIIEKIALLLVNINKNDQHMPHFSIRPNHHHQTIERSDSVQASLRIGAQTINRGHPEIHKLTVANKLLGGFFGSRLMKKLREEKGLTYGVYSSITHAKNASYWTISTEMKIDNAEHSLEAIHEIITELAQNYPSLSEVIMLKNFLRGKFLSSMNSILDVASMYSLLFVNGIPQHFLKTSLETIDTIRPKDISEMIHKYYLNADKSSLSVR